MVKKRLGEVRRGRFRCVGTPTYKRRAGDRQCGVSANANWRATEALCRIAGRRIKIRGVIMLQYPSLTSDMQVDNAV